MTDHDYNILHHAIGAPKHQAECEKSWRNYYCTDGRDADCERLVADGFMSVLRVWESENLIYYGVTAAGIEEVKRRLPLLRRWWVEADGWSGFVHAESRGKARARVILDIMDAHCLTWREALRHVFSVRSARALGDGGMG